MPTDRYKCVNRNSPECIFEKVKDIRLDSLKQFFLFKTYLFVFFFNVVQNRVNPKSSLLIEDPTTMGDISFGDIGRQ